MVRWQSNHRYAARQPVSPAVHDVGASGKKYSNLAKFSATYAKRGNKRTIMALDSQDGSRTCNIVLAGGQICPSSGGTYIRAHISARNVTLSSNDADVMAHSVHFSDEHFLVLHYRGGVALTIRLDTDLHRLDIDRKSIDLTRLLHLSPMLLLHRATSLGLCALLHSHLNTILHCWQVQS